MTELSWAEVGELYTTNQAKMGIYEFYIYQHDFSLGEGAQWILSIEIKGYVLVRMAFNGDDDGKQAAKDAAKPFLLSWLASEAELLAIDLGLKDGPVEPKNDSPGVGW